MNRMTMRERMLAVIHGRPSDRVPFVQYDNVAAPNEEVFALLGRGNIGLLRPVPCFIFEAENCHWELDEYRRDGRPCRRRCLHTPVGRLTEERLLDAVVGEEGWRRPFVRRVGDYAMLLAYLRDVEVQPNLDMIARTRAEIGDDGLVYATLPRTPYQQLIMEWVDGESLSWHLLEAPDLVLACIDQMIRLQLELFDILRDAEIDCALFPDHIHAPMIGRTCFNKYCLPLYNRLARRLAERDVPLFVRMDGDLRPLWYDIEDSLIGGIDGLSPPPTHDTTLEQAHEMWPRLFVGVNFPTSLHLKPAGIVYEKATELLRTASTWGRVQLQLGEPLPPGRWRITLPAICKAIEDMSSVSH